MRKERTGMGIGMGLHLLLLVAMVTTNILSLYHLSSTRNNSPPHPQILDPAAADVPNHLLQQLHSIRATITHLTRLRSSPSSASASSSPAASPSELLLFSHVGPIASACSNHPDLLHRYMNYTPFGPCPRDLHSVAEPLLLRGCHPLPRRRCFSPTPPKPLNPSSLPSDPFPPSLPDAAVLWPPAAPCRSFSCLPTSLGFDPKTEAFRFLSAKSSLDLPLPQLLSLARSAGAAPIRLALDVGGGTGTLAAHLRLLANATVLTTTMNLGAPYSEAAALRGVVPLHAPLQQRFPVQDGVLDLVRTGHAVNRWIPAPALEFLLYDAERVLRAGGFLWVDHFFCKGSDLDAVYAPMIGRLGYKIIKWAVGNKTDARLRYGGVYLTTLLQKPLPATAAKA
ncbi:LOW QUALITY PROTEIN: probable methyltransferase At1g29790 [Elaeis guineensis]|uniref:LOW QUALITY PROTEIN: probable methyltransferase At1g29790 n=1 Tax=Elaeis guineensis var. tenera TaxID=51953 RepID=UPI003C6D1C22